MTSGDFDPMESSGFVTGKAEPGVAGVGVVATDVEVVDVDTVVAVALFGVRVTFVCVDLCVVGEAVEAVEAVDWFRATLPSLADVFAGTLESAGRVEFVCGTACTESWLQPIKDKVQSRALNKIRSGGNWAHLTCSKVRQRLNDIKRAG